MTRPQTVLDAGLADWRDGGPCGCVKEHITTAADVGPAVMPPQSSRPSEQRTLAGRIQVRIQSQPEKADQRNIIGG